MKNPVATALVILCLWPALAVADPETDRAITATALDYAEGWFTADGERMQRALHPEFMKRRVLTDVASGDQVVQEMDAQTMVRATMQGLGRGAWSGPLDFRVTILDRYEGMADVRVVSPLYVDYLHVVKWGERWVILSVMWGPFGG
jgi:hypothetical protein